MRNTKVGKELSMPGNLGKLKEYFDEHVLPCRLCSSDATIGSFFSYEKLPPYGVGNNATILIIGHSPKVRTNSQPKITVTLDLNRESALKKYITKRILSPLGIALEECAATNLVKCQTINRMPEDIRIAGRRNFVERAFMYCGRHLENEISLSSPSLIISLSERVAVLLQKRFSPDTRVLQMQEIYGTKQKLKVKSSDYLWIPVVHIPKPGTRVHSYYFPEQTHRLQMLHDQIQESL